MRMLARHLCGTTPSPPPPVLKAEKVGELCSKAFKLIGLFLRLYLLQMAVESCPKGRTSALVPRAEQKRPLPAEPSRAEPSAVSRRGMCCLGQAGVSLWERKAVSAGPSDGNKARGLREKIRTKTILRDFVFSARNIGSSRLD